MELTINSEIKSILQERHLPINDSVGFLICLYYKIKPSYIPKELQRKIFSTKIIDKNYETDEIIWKVSLFEETETGFEWIKDWMDMFGRVNPDRRGVKTDVLRRMKKFFSNNPSIRTDDVIRATEFYIRGVSDSKYLKKSHKFIYEQDGTSMLLEYVERLKERVQTIQENVI